jgi:hypothetical protein
MADVNDKQAALGKLFATVYVPAFIKRCADLGLSIENEDQLSKCLDIGAMLNVAESTKSASAGNDLLTVAHNQLGQFMKSAGLLNPEPDTAQNLSEDALQALAAVA